MHRNGSIPVLYASVTIRYLSEVFLAYWQVNALVPPACNILSILEVHIIINILCTSCLFYGLLLNRFSSFRKHLQRFQQRHSNTAAIRLVTAVYAHMWTVTPDNIQKAFQ